MKKTLPFIVAVTAMIAMDAPAANARVVCNHDPVCQAKRDGISVAAASARENARTQCFASAGYTAADWDAYSVPAGPAAKIRSCFRSHGIRE